MSSTNIADTSSWLPLDGLEPGFDENRATPTSALEGYEFVSANASGLQITHRFAEGRMHWSYPTRTSGRRHRDAAYEAYEVAEGLYYAQIRSEDVPGQAASVFIDQTNGRGLTVIATIGEAGSGITAVQHRFIPFAIAGTAVHGELPHESHDLIGRRAYWRYSKEHAYEHVYLSPQWYTWHCLAGPERGLADTDVCTTYKLRDDIYVFTWREKVIPCGSVTVADHRDHDNLRSHGYLFGLDETGEKTVHFTFGAFGKVLNTAHYPSDLDPGASHD